MTTYNNIIEVLKDNRQLVINRYDNTKKEISLKNYMNVVLWWFEQHPQITKKCVANVNKYGAQEAVYDIERACNIANRKANEQYNNEIIMAKYRSSNMMGQYYKKYGI